MVSGLEALGGPVEEENSRPISLEEVPLLQADLSYGDILREGAIAHAPRPTLLTITVLPPAPKGRVNPRASMAPVPPHPAVVQRRMELLTSDMLSRALTLVSKGQPDRAHHLLSETRSILKGLGKGGLPPTPPPPDMQHRKDNRAENRVTAIRSPLLSSNGINSPRDSLSERRTTPPSHTSSPYMPASGIDATTMEALDAELEAPLEWINHPAVFGRDSRKAVLQSIGVISSQRSFTFRSPIESLCATRIAGVMRMAESARNWRDSEWEAIGEEN